MATKREAKQAAQEMLMHGVANVLGYWREDSVNMDQVAALGLSMDEFETILTAQANRIASLFSYESAWRN